MPDPIVTLAAAHVLRESFTAIVKPTADYLGVELREFTAAQVERLRRISGSAKRKLGMRLEQDGAVNPRVFRNVVDEGYLCPDALSADYYGGFLASSHSFKGKDDTNIPFVSLINRMSSDQIRGHWILYSILFNHMDGRRDLNLYISEHRRQAALYVPWATFMFLLEGLQADNIEESAAGFEFSGSDRCHSVTIELQPVDADSFDVRRLDVSFWTLLNDGLVDELYWGMTGWDLADRMRKDYPSDPLRIGRKDISAEQLWRIVESGKEFSDSTSMSKGGIVFVPSIFGMDLFLRAQGQSPAGHIGFECLEYKFLPSQIRELLFRDVKLVDN